MPAHGQLLHISARDGRALRAARPDAAVAELVAGRFQALSDPTRLNLALALDGGRELCVCDLAWIAERAQNLVSHHMRALKVRGLVRSRRDGKMVMYSLTEQGAAMVQTTLRQLDEPGPAR